MVSESLFCMVWQYREMGMSDYSIDCLSGRLKTEFLGFQTAFSLREYYLTISQRSLSAASNTTFMLVMVLAVSATSQFWT